MSWKINYSEQALEDLKSIYEYIAYELLVPDAAAKQVNRIMQSVKELDEMPMRYKVFEEEPWKSKQLRSYPVNNFVVFYLPKEETNTVYIVRIIYGGRDIEQQLNETKDI